MISRTVNLCSKSNLLNKVCNSFIEARSHGYLLLLIFYLSWLIVRSVQSSCPPTECISNAARCGVVALKATPVRIFNKARSAVVPSLVTSTAEGLWSPVV